MAIKPWKYKDSIWIQAAEQLGQETGITVVRWRRRNSGVAYMDDPDWSIEAPLPKGPVSFAVFAHEVAHQVLHRHNGKTPRWVEEVEAWEYALEQLERFSLPGYEKALAAAIKDVDYAFGKAYRRGVNADLVRSRFPAWFDRCVARAEERAS